MPKFATLSVEEAQLVTGSDKRQKELADYIRSVSSLPFGRIGKVVPSEGETLSTVRRRLGDAIRRSGRNMEIKRADDAVYYWMREPRRRGRPRKPRA